MSSSTAAWHSPAHTGWRSPTKVWAHVLTGVGGPKGGNGREGVKFGVFLKNCRHVVHLRIPHDLEVTQIMCFYGHKMFPKEHEPQEPHQCGGLCARGLHSTAAFRGGAGIWGPGLLNCSCPFLGG